ncbi:MAG: helix-hairpin-helix domain-containing protein [Desulfurivibrionaceae bacterium]|jgi:competence protein ComEA
MNASGGEIGRKDLRPLALLLFALCILTVAAARMGGLADLIRQTSAPQRLVWQEGPLEPGLYRAEGDSPTGGQPRTAPAPSLESQASEIPPARLAPLFFKPIPFHQADEELLITIPGIGPVLARRIIEFREQHGKITSIDELDAVKGIGPAKLEKLKAHLVVD